jgi:hypothetical protein
MWPSVVRAWIWRAGGFVTLMMLSTLAVRADSVGCTLHHNTAPAYGDRPYCAFSIGSSCYYCEYSIRGVGGYTICSETPDQSIQWCVDSRDLPPFQVWSPGLIGEVLASLAPSLAAPMPPSSIAYREAGR